MFSGNDVAITFFNCQQLCFPEGDLHKIGSINFSSWNGKGAYDPTSFPENYRQLTVSKGGGL